MTLTKYTNPSAVGYQGYLEPADKSWIAFVDLDGRATFFLTRDASGACL